MSGMQIVYNHFPAKAAKLEVGAKAAEWLSAKHIAATAEHAAPVRTGKLRGSGHAIGNVVVFVAPYSGFVEHGTKFMGPEPFLSPALEAERARFEAELMALVRDG